MNKLTIALLLLLSTYTSIAQTVRYLEKKDYEKEAGNNMVFVQPSVSENNSRLAITTFKTDFSKDYKQIKSAYSSKIINLKNGRLELNQDGISASYFQNELIVADFSKLNQWLETGKYMSEVANAPYFLMLGNNEKRNMGKPPEGYYPYSPIGKYWGFASSDLQKLSSVLAEEKNGQFEIIYKFDFNIGKLSPDGTKIYGGNPKQKNIKIYNIQSGKLLQTIKFKEMPLDVLILNDNRLFCSLMKYKLGANEMVYSAKILSPDGLSTIKEFSNLSLHSQITDNGQYLISVSDSGTIKLIDVASGQILTETKDTYIIKVADLAIKGGKSVSPLLKINGGDFCLIPYSTGIMSLFNTKERKVVASIFTDMEDWAVIAKDGRIDGTQGAFEKLEWREYDGDKLVRTASVESSFDKYYTPRLLYTILNGDEPIAPEVNAVKTVTIDEDMKQVPALEWLNVNDKTVTREAGSLATYSSIQKSITLQLKVTANMDRIKEVRLYHNGKLVGNQPANGTASYTFSASLNSLFGDANSIYAIASTKDGLDSEKCKLTVTYSEKDKTKAKLYALVVGINKYQNPRYELNYALPDATAIKNQLEKGGAALFESIVVKTLFEGQATKANVINAFNEMSSTVQEQDMFIFYYAGHGTMSEAPANEFYIVPQDVTQLYGNETLLKEKAISASEIKKLSMAINAQKQVFIIDACHSAGALNSAVTRGAAEEKAIGQLARSTGTFWLTAAGSEQFATEFAQLGHGVFTYSLLEALQGKDAGIISDGSLTIRELSTYIEQRVPELSAKYKGTAQYPASFSFGYDFPILIFGMKN